MVLYFLIIRLTLLSSAHVRRHQTIFPGSPSPYLANRPVCRYVQNLLVNLHKGSVIGVPHVPEYKPNSQKANSDTISVGKNKGDRKPKKDCLSQACCNLCRYRIPGLRAFIKGTTLSDKDNPVDDPRSKYEQSRYCDE